MTEEVAQALQELDREDWRLERQWKRHMVSFEEMENLSTAASEDDELCAPYIQQDLLNEMDSILASLPEIQRIRYSKWAMGMTTREIAAEEGVDHAAVVRSISRVQRKLKKIF